MSDADASQRAENKRGEMRAGARLRAKSRRKGGREGGWGEVERGKERGRKGKVEEIALQNAERGEVRGERKDDTMPLLSPL